MRVENFAKFLERAGLTWLAPLARLCAGDDPRQQLRALGVLVGVPLSAVAVFLLLWQWAAAGVQTSLGSIPGPPQVWSAFNGLVDAHHTERAKAAAFYARQELRQAEQLQKNPAAKIKPHQWTGKSTFFDQILTSLKTVFAGFLVATLVAVPLGILCGSNRLIQTALNPLIQIFKPVSPLAWLPLVTLAVSAVYTTQHGWVDKAFITSAITVTLCSLWPTLINTALGVSAVDKDLLNVAHVLKLSWFKRITKIVIPSALPLIFTGLRLSLGVGWMVLIAAEMLAQNPGLGKFVWDEFQNGSSQSLGRMMVAVFVIGIIGFLLDRVMQTLQQFTSHTDARLI
jgi:nitrate/nitrite transport system permease protein